MLWTRLNLGISRVGSFLSKKSYTLIFMCGMDGNENVACKFQAKSVTRPMEECIRDICHSCRMLVEGLAHTCAWVEGYIQLLQSVHGLKYESNMFRWNDVIDDACIVRCQSHFDGCWIMGSLGATFSVD